MTNFYKDNSIINMRDVFDKIEKLEDELSEIDDLESELVNLEDEEEIKVAKEELKILYEKFSDEIQELEDLKSLVSEFQGYGGDEKWRGSWYPSHIIHEDYFEDYTKQLVEDCGYISKNFPGWIEIDWGATAENVKQDYTSGDFLGETYWGR